ncbi:hypothetical protein I315_06851 [Cryptococcus gattii Ru294]|uniref:ADF-H domain-containing protein n=4 Tax=Cryptococcus gattii species complex TaxID=1884637 RepID=E6R1A8_CRYGW|nr:uncharacterized protein CGB_B8030C [Cryptococcus gattii WM276]KIR45047.1 hypothetical protein I312_05822 [Cryptococcus bacillisporus CA1280]KIR50730.1 hypothetical protein I315_06851 [Cryptococcus gattii Ru294]KIR57776.1 hypothetical protein I314_06495 [Cryptococcus bacillisporus CA1873]KIR76866.1 hypothetical protein I306_06141 [Cryptococcus gattii EJB2]KIY31275.1 hypothetical protein I305_06384 [Cryptococcus gattii E566]KJE02287.1 hypothetical protein I311_04057 [Cryptococcus gattii NT-1|eukprot:KIR57776.1 hypothetical protein I314_06495 [Cryptococcus gattii CA1873]
MADVSDPKIAEAYEQIRSNGGEETWMLLDYESEKSNKLVLTATGKGDLSELSAQLKPENASFAYAKVRYENDEHSFREKFILVIWIGENVKVMRRARVSVHAADVKKVLRAYSIEVSASTPTDLEQDDIVTRLRRAGGANYDRSKFD